MREIAGTNGGDRRHNGHHMIFNFAVLRCADRSQRTGGRAQPEASERVAGNGTARNLESERVVTIDDDRVADDPFQYAAKIAVAVEVHPGRQPRTGRHCCTFTVTLASAIPTRITPNVTPSSSPPLASSPSADADG